MRIVLAAIAGTLLASCSAGTGSRMFPATPSRVSAMQVRPLGSYKSIFSFGTYNGAGPYASLVNLNGTLYGTTYAGGGGNGTVFSITPTGTEKVVYSFKGGNDGVAPFASLIAVNGVLYGTTLYGGTSRDGTVFSVTPSGKEKVLHSFKGGSDGKEPEAPLVNAGGVLYGTTYSGGAANYGVVFSITTSGSENVLHAFKGGKSDGAEPIAGLIALKKTLYGTTYNGGSSSDGTVFKITTGGAESVLHFFKGKDGDHPQYALTYVGGALYGTTLVGGGGRGTVFKITTAGVESVLHSFKGVSDGANPYYGNLVNVKGVLYGTTAAGGKTGYGTVFKVTTAGVESVLYAFRSGTDGASPFGGLVNLNGTLFGTTARGGSGTAGTVFSIAP